VIVATLASNNYRKRQADYVNNLFRACNKHITLPFKFVCFTDNASGFDPGVEVIHLPGKDVCWGWWNKLAMFAAPELPKGERVLFFDADTLVLANIDDLAAYAGPFAVLGGPRDYRGVGSGILAWEAGSCAHIWSNWLAAGKPILGNGDDEWIDRQMPHAERINRLYPGIYSYRYHKLQQAPRPDTRIVFFQREPKCDNCGGWAQHYWSTLDMGELTPSVYRA
jgi:hypothetical protein